MPDKARDSRLSKAQAAMLRKLEAQGGRLNAPYGNREAGRAASAFWRTARALIDRGLVDMVGTYIGIQKSSKPLPPR